MNQVDSGAQEWINRAEAAGFEVAWNIALPKRKSPSGVIKRYRYEVILSQSKGAQSIQEEVELWRHGVVEAKELIALVPAEGEITDSSIDPQKSILYGKTREVKLKVSGVAQEFFDYVLAYVNEKRRVHERSWKLNRIFDEKVKDILAADPELLGLQAERARLEEIEEQTRTRRLAEIEAERENFLFVADPERGSGREL